MSFEVAKSGIVGLLLHLRMNDTCLEVYGYLLLSVKKVVIPNFLQLIDP